MVHPIGTMDTYGCGYPAIGRNTIANGFMDIMCAPVSGIANTSTNATVTGIMIITITNITRTSTSPI